MCQEVRGATIKGEEFDGVTFTIHRAHDELRISRLRFARSPQCVIIVESSMPQEEPGVAIRPRLFQMFRTETEAEQAYRDLVGEHLVGSVCGVELKTTEFRDFCGASSGATRYVVRLGDAVGLRFRDVKLTLDAGPSETAMDFQATVRTAADGSVEVARIDTVSLQEPRSVRFLASLLNRRNLIMATTKAIRDHRPQAF
ncbi:MAG TPA: hypothetical protein VNC50_00330 [Planctomycetia bacterium]|jgi:hypothetical protein|nr:hypothetical protein [Planctomycetia bacterium]